MLDQAEAAIIKGNLEAALLLIAQGRRQQHKGGNNERVKRRADELSARVAAEKGKVLAEERCFGALEAGLNIPAYNHSLSCKNEYS